MGLTTAESVLAEQKAVAGEVDAKLLVERLIGVSSDDHERFLLKIKNRFDRVGMELPTIEVRAEGLAVDVEAYAGTGATPNIINSTSNFFLDIADTLHVLPSSWKIKYTILHKTSAVIRPHRMTLLLGSPGSGKTTLLKALAGKLDSRLEIDEQQVSGRVAYNGHGMDKFVPEKTAAYISQDDLHSGEMTVRETLSFSASCQGNGYLDDILTDLIRRERESNITPEDDIDMFMQVKKLNQPLPAATTQTKMCKTVSDGDLIPSLTPKIGCKVYKITLQQMIQTKHPFDASSPLHLRNESRTRTTQQQQSSPSPFFLEAVHEAVEVEELQDAVQERSGEGERHQHRGPKEQLSGPRRCRSSSRALHGLGFAPR
ncbi:hypothetical protein EJB05_16405, partial [Eragrostis curvula]